MSKKFISSLSYTRILMGIIFKINCVDFVYQLHLFNWVVFKWYSVEFWPYFSTRENKFLFKSWFIFWLHICIQQPQKPMGHFDCEEFTYQTYDFNKSLLDSRQIRSENK